jgi:imidazolonepropionase-like amidohydrolase
MRKNALAIALLAIIVCISGFVQAAEQPLPRLTLISNVNIFDGKTENLHKNMHVLVKDNFIETVSNEPLAVIQTDNVTMIDGGARTLMPGLIDAHWHTTYSYLSQAEMFISDVAMITIAAVKGAEPTLMRGFTTVRDMGGNCFSLKKAIDRGMINGPRIYPSGAPICQTSGHFDFRGPNDVPANNTDPLSYFERNGVVMVADGVPEVIKRVRENLRMGATQIKLAAGAGVSSLYDPLDVSEYTYEELKAAVDVAKTWNTYVAVHVFTDEAVQTSLKAGIKSIEHGMLLSEETLKMIKEKGAWLSIQPLLNDEDAFEFADPVSNRKFINVTEGTVKVYELAKMLGVKIAFGTDMLFDPEIAAKQGKFLTKLKRWFTPYEALKMATSTNAELLALSGPRNPYPEGPLGVIEEGAYADLLLVDGNPLQNLDLVADPDKNFVVIMKDGKIYKNTVQ